MASSAFFVAALSSLMVLGLGTKVHFTNCGSEEAAIKSIDISNCDSPRCIFKKGTNVSVEIDFTASKAITGATSQVHGILFGLPAPFPLPDSNACHFMNCPISVGTDVKYKNSIYVEPMYPSINVDVRWKLVSSTGTVLCFRVPARVEA